ncbi:MAG TPA: sugar phosphate isomerase/epimerase [Chitinophagaceae bacterium]|nr:sugar phosphate isomerase/epimerase [Chitinophagaceae bacterium]
MITRRNFLQTAAMSAAGVLISKPLFAESRLIKKVGIQLFSVPKGLDTDFEGTIKMLANMGYTEIEMYGPYPFSTQAAKDSWNAVTPSLGFKGSGFFGHTAKEVKSIFKANGMTVPSMHTDLDTLSTAMDKLAEAAHTLGATYVVLPAIPGDKRKTLDDYKKMADNFNAIGASAKKAGIKFGYHNHGYGLKEMDGQIPLRVILDNTDKDLVFFEMDLYWTTAGGADPIELFTHYPNRYNLVHIKDMMKKVHFSGDGGDPKQWIELFPYMTSAGSGVLDLKAILTAAKNNGVKYFIVEQDMVANPEVALKKSYNYVASL